MGRPCHIRISRLPDGTYMAWCTGCLWDTTYGALSWAKAAGQTHLRETG